MWNNGNLKLKRILSVCLLVVIIFSSCKKNDADNSIDNRFVREPALSETDDSIDVDMPSSSPKPSENITQSNAIILTNSYLPKSEIIEGEGDTVTLRYLWARRSWCY